MKSISKSWNWTRGKTRKFLSFSVFKSVSFLCFSTNVFKKQNMVLTFARKFFVFSQEKAFLFWNFADSEEETQSRESEESQQRWRRWRWSTKYFSWSKRRWLWENKSSASSSTQPTSIFVIFFVNILDLFLNVVFLDCNKYSLFFVSRSPSPLSFLSSNPQFQPWWATRISTTSISTKFFLFWLCLNVWIAFRINTIGRKISRSIWFM